MGNMVMLVVVSALLAIFGGASGWYRVLYLAVGLILVMRWLLRSNRKLMVTRNLIRSSGFAGTPLSLGVSLTNPTPLPVFWLMVRHDFSEELGAVRAASLLFLPPRGNKELKVGFDGLKRGFYPVPETKVILGDPWGFKEEEMNFPCQERIVIYPPLIPIYGLEIIRHLPMGRKRIFQGLHEDPSRLRGCRGYVPGDSFKRIHWPNAAKTGQLQVKEWETTLNAEISIFLNLQEPDYPVYEWLALSETGIELAAGIAHLLLGQGERLGFYSNGLTEELTGENKLFETPPKTGNAQEQMIMTYLAGARLGNYCGVTDLLAAGEHMPVGSCLLLITPRIDAVIVRKAESLRRKGLHPTLLWLGGRKGELPEAEIRQARIPCYKAEKRRDTNGIYLSPENGA